MSQGQEDDPSEAPSNAPSAPAGGPVKRARKTKSKPAEEKLVEARLEPKRMIPIDADTPPTSSASRAKLAPVRVPPAPSSKAPARTDPDAPSVPVIPPHDPPPEDAIKGSVAEVSAEDAALAEFDSVAPQEAPPEEVPRPGAAIPVDLDEKALEEFDSSSQIPRPQTPPETGLAEAASPTLASGAPPAPSQGHPIKSSGPPPAPSSSLPPRMKGASTRSPGGRGKTPLPPAPVRTPLPPAPAMPPAEGAIEIREAGTSTIDTSKDTPVPPPTSWAPAPPGSVPDPALPSMSHPPVSAPPASAPTITTSEVAEGEASIDDLDDFGNVDDELEDFSPAPAEAVAQQGPSSADTGGSDPGIRSSVTTSAPPLPLSDRKPPPPRRTIKPTLPKVKQPRKKPWWETLFGDDFSRAYRPMSESQLRREVDFILEGLDVPPGAVILDLGCGQGEICVELSRRGYSVVGYDLSVYQLAMAGDHAQAAGQKINFLQGDMREMAFEQMFDAVISWDTSFGYFEEEKNMEVLRRIKKALKPNGRLILDVMNRDFAAREAPYNHWFEGDGCVCMDDMSMDWITNRLSVKRSIILDDGRSKELNYSTRLYNLSEVGRMLHEAGFRVAAVSGDVATKGAFFGPHSRRIIIQAGKP